MLYEFHGKIFKNCLYLLNKLLVKCLHFKIATHCCKRALHFKIIYELRKKYFPLFKSFNNILPGLRSSFVLVNGHSNKSRFV